MRSVVTGGAGFIGSHVVDALVARGDEVTVVDDLSSGRREFVNAQAQFVEHDIREPFLFDAEVVFHLAAQADVGTSVQRPAFDAEVNVLGTVNVLEAARATGAAVVFSSTGGAIYGDVDAPAAEDAPLRPVSPYGMAKLSAEAYVEGWRRVHGLRSVVLRFANVYGPRQSAALEGGVIAIFLERLEAGEETLVFGDGEQTRDFVHVDDVVRALLAAAGHDEGVFNVGTGVETSVNRLHELCRAASGIDAPPRHGPPRLGDARRSVLDVSRARSELGWRPKVDLAKGLRSTWASMRAGKE
jgi:UDP-glucose 4-epimerase